MKKVAATTTAAVMTLMFAASTVYADGYGAAGCGLGSIIIGSDPGFMQVFAATTNGSSGTQTFGISSGTSNCASSDGGAASAKAFIETNREAFSKDVARGQGETIANLATLAGCADSAAVGSTLQQNFGQIFPEASVSDTQVSQSVLDTLKGHPELACRQLS